MLYRLVILLLLIATAAFGRDGYSSGYTRQVITGYQTRTPTPLQIVVFHSDDGYSSRHAGWPTESFADTTTYLDTDGSLMAHDYIGHNGSTWEGDEYVSVEINGGHRVYGSATLAFPAWAATYAGYAMAWADLDQLRKNIRIKSARLCFFVNQTLQSDAVFYGYSANFLDGLNAVLDTNLAHVAWVDGTPGAGCDPASYTDPRYRDASWDLADNDTDNGGLSTTAWGDPPLEDPGGGGTYLSDPFQWGIKSGQIWEVDGDTYDEISFDVTEAVQQYISSTTMANAGWWILPTYSCGSHFYPCYGPAGQSPAGSDGTFTNKQWFLVVEYYEERYRQRWDDHPLAVVITFDDNYDENLDIQTDLVAAGWGATSFIIKNKLHDIYPDGVDPRLTVANLNTIIGMNPLGIGMHSRRHMKDPKTQYLRIFPATTVRGVFSWGWHLGGDYPPTGYDADSLASDLERSWGDSISNAIPKTFAYPAHHRNLQSDLILKEKGYIGARTGVTLLKAVDGPGVAWDLNGEYGAPAAPLRWYPPNDRDRPVNLFSISLFGSFCDLFGEWNETFTKAEIREAWFGEFVEEAVDSGYALIVLMGHQYKAEGTGTCGVTDAELVLFDEILNESGGDRFKKFPSFEAALKWYRQPEFHQPADAPTWDTEATTQNIVAADSLYWDKSPNCKGVR